MTKPIQEIDDASLNHLVVAQLSKTKLCAMFARGSCNDSSCRFAHSMRELRAPPDLTKTAMCRAFARGDCEDPACKFAHGESELRVTQSVYKTQLCNFYTRGHCKKGHRCRHAHGTQELRNFQLEAQPQREAQQNADRPKPLSPGRVDTGVRKPTEESPSEKTGGHFPVFSGDALGRLSADLFVPPAPLAPLAPPGLERETPTELPTVKTPPLGQWSPETQLYVDDMDKSACIEAPMKVPLPIRPMERSPLLPRCGPCGPGLTAPEELEVPSSSLVPTPPLAGWSPAPGTPSLPNLRTGPFWRAADMQLPQLSADADPVGLAAAMAAAAMEHTAAASLASMQAWSWANVAMKASQANSNNLNKMERDGCGYPALQPLPHSFWPAEQGKPHPAALATATRISA